jgi:hypothetical protein
VNADDGFVTFAPDAGVARWAEVARGRAARLARDAALQAANLRHQGTWFVGVDVLPNATDGSLEGVPLTGPWAPYVPDLPLHPAQVSIIYPGYPKQDPQESDANHRYRAMRAAAHVDGLLPVGPKKRRYAQEFHAYILGIPLTSVAQAPTVVWRGSHLIMQAALAEAIGRRNPDEVDVTDVYQAARREVFATCERVPLRVPLGGAMLIHRFALHGTEPWEGEAAAPDGRMIAFFRPETSPEAWLSAVEVG